MPQHPHILIRNKALWLHHSYIVAECKVSEEYMKVSRSRYKASVSPSFHTRDMMPDTGKAWRWATINDQLYYAYDNIPDKAPAKYRSTLPSKAELTANVGAGLAPAPYGNNDFETHFKAFLNNNYTSYLHCYGNCSKTQQTNLARAASLLQGAVEYINTNGINMKKSQFFEELARFVAKHEVKYFPENPRVIKRKLAPFFTQTASVSDSEHVGSPFALQGERQGIEGNTVSIATTIQLPRANNQNAKGDFNDEEVRTWVLQLREMGQNYTNSFIIRKIQDVCTLTTKPTPSDRWIGKIMEERNTQYLTAVQRFGEKGRLAKVISSYQPFQNALFAGDCWQIDGTRVNLVPHKHTFTSKDKDGNTTTKTAPAFVDIITVRDVHSGDILGWHYTLNEDRWSVISAIQMACKETGYLPYEMIFDKFPGHNTPEGEEFIAMLRNMGTIVTLSSDPKVKAGLERWYSTLQTVFMQDSQYYYGQGIKSRRTYAHRSESYIKRMKQIAWKEGFDWEAACAAATAIVEAYKNTQYCKYSRKHSRVQQTPVELHQISDKPNVRTLDAEDINYLFGYRKNIAIDGKGLIVTEIQKQTYYFRCPDTEVFGKHGKVLMIYDLEDLSHVSLYSITDGPIKQYLGKAAEVIPAQRYGPDADWGIIATRKAELKQLDDFREQEFEYKATGTDGIFDITSLIAPMSVIKSQANNTESQFMTDTAPPDNWDEDDDEINFSPRNQY